MPLMMAEAARRSAFTVDFAVMGRRFPAIAGLEIQGAARHSGLLHACNENGPSMFFSGDIFAKPALVWCNTYNFLEQEVGPGFRVPQNRSPMFNLGET